MPEQPGKTATETRSQVGGAETKMPNPEAEASSPLDPEEVFRLLDLQNEFTQSELGGESDPEAELAMEANEWVVGHIGNSVTTDQMGTSLTRLREMVEVKGIKSVDAVPGFKAEIIDSIDFALESIANPRGAREKIVYFNNEIAAAKTSSPRQTESTVEAPREEPRMSGMSAEEIAAARVLVGRMSSSSRERPATPTERARAKVERISSQSELVDSVDVAATGSVIISTDLPGKVEVNRGSIGNVPQHEARAGYGFCTFGDYSDRTEFEAHSALPSYTRGGGTVLTHEGVYPPDMAELVAFEPATRDVITNVTEEYRERGAFGRTKVVSAEVPKVTGQEPIMWHDPTGRKPDEPGVFFDYQFRPYELYGKSYTSATELKGIGFAPYRVSDGREGGELIIRVLLPETVANDLKQAIQDDPAVARRVAERIVLDRGGLDPSVWEGGGGKNPVRPPWEGTPPSHHLYMLEPQEGQDPASRISRMTATKLDKPFVNAT